MALDLKGRKLLPINQTARSDALVRGNPVTTRPDDAVENTFPGLEFDHRNLEKQFFPGLVFELHHGASAWLREVDHARGLPISEAERAAGLTLWRIVGNFPATDGTGRVTRSQFPVFGRSGARVWQLLREIEPGEIAVVLGPLRAIDQTVPEALDQQIDAALSGGEDSAFTFDGMRIVVLFGQRADYLSNGVIDPNLYEVGDLTRSLCAPWQYDFTDCGCWYWASNKPDMVAVAEGGPQIFNFQRVRTGDEAPEPPKHPPVVSNADWLDGRSVDAGGSPLPDEERVPRQMNHAELILGWESLPIVAHDVEASKYVPRQDDTLPNDQLFPDLEIIVARLTYLAGIEHALMVEYLYAFYSIDAPRTRPDLADEPALRRYEAAMTILGVAIDEMRHFRWANEILVLLGQSPVIARAERTLDLDNDDRFLEHTFALVPANQAQVNWFITVERPSKEVDPDQRPDTVDGMYTRLLLSIERSPEIEESIKNRVLHLIKLIIDEGYDHYHRFQRVKQLLPSAPDVGHLRLPANPNPLPAAHPAKELEIRVDRSYEVILNLLLIVFGRGDAEHGDLLEATRIAMVDSMDVEAMELIAGGGAPLFSPPRTATTRNLGRFSLEMSAVRAEVPVVRITPEPASPRSVVAEATQPLDLLNERHLTAGDETLRASAMRSIAAMERVRGRFVEIMGLGEQ